MSATVSDDVSSAWDWGVVLDRQRPKLLAVLRARLRDPHAVDDVYQMVALAVAQAKRPPTTEGELAPWLYRIAVRQCLLFRRSAGRRARHTHAYADLARAGSPKAAPDPLTWLIREERERAFHKALAQLPDLDRQVLVLKCYESWSYQQIAHYLGVTERTIEHRLLKARQRLRQTLAERAGDGESTCIQRIGN